MKAVAIWALGAICHLCNRVSAWCSEKRWWLKYGEWYKQHQNEAEE